MKKLLLLSLFIAITIQINGQQLSDVDNQYYDLAIEAELQRKDKLEKSSLNVLKRDSTYLYDDFEDNLQRKWIYYDYNSANNYASYQYFVLDENMEWTPSFLRNRMFNSDGSVSSYITQKYEDGGLVNSSKVTYEYNESGLTTLDDRERWDDDLQEWGPFLRFERTYNADNTLLSLTFYNTDLATGNLELAYIINYTNVDNVITEWLMEDYNNGVLYNMEKTEVYLNADNDRDSTYTYEWNAVFSSWDLISRYVYPEDLTAPVRAYQRDLYEEVTDSWDPDFRTVYYDHADLDEVQYLDRFSSNEGDPEMFLDRRLEYFWSDNQLVDLEVATVNEIDIVMPNPFEDNSQITVNGVKENTSFVLYDVHGNTMFTKDLKQSNSFSLNNLPNGIYFINLIQAGNIVEVKKIVKAR